MLKATKIIFFSLSICLWTFSSTAFAADKKPKPVVSKDVEDGKKLNKGKLPKGKSAVDKARTKRPKKTKRRRRNCYLDMTNPPGGSGHFSADGKWFYLLANTGEEKGEHGRLAAKYTLYQMNMETYTTEPLVGLTQKRGASLVTIGNPVEIALAISFYGKSAGCYAGGMAMVAIPLLNSEQKPTNYKSKGRRMLVRSPEGLKVLDAKQRSILDMDNRTFQTRRAVGYAKGQRPLWYDTKTKEMIVWQRGNVSGLKAITNSKVTRKMALKRGQRVLQQEGLFGIAGMNTADNEIEIIEHSKWSGVAKNEKFKIIVPPAYSVNSSGMAVNFDKKLALVYGANFLAKQRWQRVFVYKYDVGSEMIAAIPVTGNEYLNYSGIDPSGKLAVIEVRDITTRQTIVLKIYDLEKKSFKDVVLAKPK